ncbi:HNH endonuclease signature motif containing protein [Paraburkholderia domus]|uniref:HNH endonuclease signature motif containing protein n=1 Tax=Paraburkholderia domus TaxID=2793075 RepID=UPI001F197133|nr:HNH endonuclease signature motif containing protein [Paraburkholderia domus]
MLPQLVMSAKRSVWRMNDHAGEDADREFQQKRLSVLEACGNECEFCGHASAKFQEVHHGDDNHANNTRENLFGSCPLCHQVFHLGLAGMRDGGAIIYLPEMSQAELNQLALLIWIIDSTHTLVESKVRNPFKDPKDFQLFKRVHSTSNKIRQMLENRRAPILMRIADYIEKTKAMPKELSPKLSDITPALFASVLMQLDDGNYAKRESALGGLRLLPKPARFEQRIVHWRDEANAILPIPSWTKILPEESIRDIVIGCVRSVTEAEQRIATAG